MPVETAGNAIRRTYADPPTIGVTNFFVDPSRGVAPLELLRALARGFYAAVLLSRPEVDFAADRFRLHAAVGDDLKFVPSGSGGAGSPTLFGPRWKGA